MYMNHFCFFFKYNNKNLIIYEYKMNIMNIIMNINYEYIYIIYE